MATQLTPFFFPDPPDKSFVTREHAAAFVAGLNPEGGAKDKGEPRFYAVAVGNLPGIYTDWAEASKAIVGAKGPKYKKFSTRAEAADFIRMYATSATRQALSGLSGASGSGAAAKGAGAGSKSLAQDEDDDDDDDDDQDDDDDDEDDDEDDDDDEDAARILQPAAKRAKHGSAAAAAAAAAAASSSVLTIYADGSSLGNGQHGASAGVGVFFGPGDKRCVFAFCFTLALVLWAATNPAETSRSG